MISNLYSNSQVRLREKILVKLKRESSKSDKNCPEQEPVTMPFQLEWSDFNFDNSSKNGMQIVKICPKIKGQRSFCLLIAVYSKFYTKNSAVPLFLGGFLPFARHYNENCLTISFFFQIEIRQVQLDWRGFQST